MFRTLQTDAEAVERTRWSPGRVTVHLLWGQQELISLVRTTKTKTELRVDFSRNYMK